MLMKKSNNYKRYKSKSQKKSSINKINGFDLKKEQKFKGKPGEIQNKYETLARDASSAGDRIAAENFMQHAEHYLRIHNSIKKAE